MKICPMAYKICQNQLNILPNNQWTVSKWPKFLTVCQRGKISPNLVTLLVSYFDLTMVKRRISSSQICRTILIIIIANFISTAEPESDNRASVPVFRLHEPLGKLRTGDGGPILLKEDWILHSNQVTILCKKNRCYRSHSIIGATPTCGQSGKGSTIVNYDSRVVPDLKIPHIMTLES